MNGLALTFSTGKDIDPQADLKRPIVLFTLQTTMGGTNTHPSINQFIIFIYYLLHAFGGLHL